MLPSFTEASTGLSKGRLFGTRVWQLALIPKVQGSVLGSHPQGSVFGSRSGPVADSADLQQVATAAMDKVKGLKWGPQMGNLKNAVEKWNRRTQLGTFL